MGTTARAKGWLLPAALAGCAWIAASAPAAAAGRFCSATAKNLFEACGLEAGNDFLVTKAKCRNLSDPTERGDCLATARQDREDAHQECRDMLDWRQTACGVVGEGRYDPDIRPNDFDDDFTSLTNPNPYFPLAIGNHWEYRSALEVDTIDIRNETKLIDGVTCIVARDLVVQNGEQAELTDDWYAQALDGTTWYFGEEAKDFESFAGDVPKLPELVSIEGSFKAGRDLDKPGIIFLASPSVGDAYFEEFSLANAEDVTEILSTTYQYGSDVDLDQMVPQALAELLCSGDCVVTKNYSLLEPGIVERKYYAPGIGVFLEVELDTGEVLQLTDCNFDPRCATLPTP